MATKIKAPPKTTGAEVMAMFKGITPSKGYASKLNSLLNFLGITSNIRIGAEVVEDGLALTHEGSIVEYNQMRKQYIRDKISHYECNDPAIKHLEDKIRQYRRDIDDCATIIRRKNKEEKKENARVKMAELEAENKERQDKINELVRIETEKQNNISLSHYEYRMALNYFAGAKVQVQLETGTYAFPVPTGTPFYREVCNLLGLPLENQEAVKKPVIKRMFTFPADVVEAIRKAMVFASTDDLRPAMTCVLLEIKDGKMLVVATDAHRLFKSRKFEVTGPPGQYEYTCCQLAH